MNTLNWFSIENWRDLKFDYRLVNVAIEGNITDGKDFNTSFNNAMKYLATSTRGVVSEMWHDGKKYIAVRSDATLKKITIPGNPLDIYLSPVEGVFTFDPALATRGEMNLATRFVENGIEYQLNRNKAIWNGGRKSFLKKTPTRNSSDIQTDIFQGFKFRVHHQNGKMYAIVDLAYRYTDKQTLSDLLKILPRDQWNERIEGRTFLYTNGDDWYTVKGKNIGGVIGNQPLDKDDFRGTVYDYITRQGKYATAEYKQPLSKNSLTFYHSYSKTSTNTVAGSTDLAKAIHFADNGLHKLSINEPHRRFFSSEFFVKKYFQNLLFAGVKLKISDQPETQVCKILKSPSLKYAKNKILDPYEAAGQPGSEFYLYPKRRREYVYKYGLLNEDPYVPQYIFAPDSLPFAFIRSVKFYFDKAMKELDKSFPGFELVQYSMKKKPFANEVAREFQEMVASKQLKGGCGLFILPEMEGAGGFSHRLHKVIKKELFGTVQLKCISERSLRQYLQEGVDRHGTKVFNVPDKFVPNFRSYQVYTLFEYLIVNKKWPYAFAENLNYDLYIGIDAHEFYAGFVFFFGNGEKIVFDVEKTAKATGTYRNEKINFAVIKNKIVEVLSRHIRSGEDFPGSIVILRDGTSFGEEQKALLAAIEEMKAEGKIDDASVQLAVLDVTKTSAMPIRAAVRDQNNILVNADCGTVVYVEPNKDAYIFNTGFPYKVPGSSNPVHVTLSWGEIDFDKALADVFALTQLTFSAPDRPSSLPLPLKLIDTIIRDIAHEYDLANTQAKELKIVQDSIKE